MKPAAIDFWISFISSSTEPMMISSFKSSLRQIGSGIPQYLDRERFQSFTFSSQLANLPSPVDLGFQLMVSLSSTKRFFTAVIFTNQESKG